MTDSLKLCSVSVLLTSLGKERKLSVDLVQILLSLIVYCDALATVVLFHSLCVFTLYKFLISVLLDGVKIKLAADLTPGYKSNIYCNCSENSNDRKRL